MSGKCYACERPITYDNFHVGHNKAKAKGGSDNVENLRPICSSCNNGMGTMSIENYKAKYFGGTKPVTAKPSTKRGKKKTKRRTMDSANSFGGASFGLTLPKVGKYKNSWL